MCPMGICWGMLFAMWLGLDVTFLNHAELTGTAGGVSLLEERDDGRRVIRRLNDASYLL